MYDVLEVLYFHKPGSDKEKSLDALRAAIAPDFIVQGMKFVDRSAFTDCRQIVHISTPVHGPFTTAQEFEASVREVAPEDRFPWQRIGAIPVGQTGVVWG